ncbi:UDP-N-acetylmuramoylalanyl-D-glutamate 2,6-diaminopimelate ligase [Campylobacter iguaniorum]|uniref:UDP-N-acetylmuramoyl-L-alanyl-D-glutamate--2,6-diaminopimelate ligase n=1 Tax=Campylobacter iguaniorum TaxID=1244531 RepID=A0A076FDT4_9BACT|nr:UDP-N-acetylmuramoyl-L-alanyl-D-glutamate--2,6-diaminopimelate ligase [Campylobacter iguaniorum]AII13989.1 UDP-N-acetylmuramoylalanyl-D-glutamate 2,6-diaminopimelate ligase [Campylobacter iguaniorum]
MKIALDEVKFITDNSQDCDKNAYFVYTNSNSKFHSKAGEQGATLISPAKAKELLGIGKNIKLIGITGTNGKTTTSAIIASALENLGFKAGLSGTRGTFLGEKQIAPKGLTTSQALETLSYLKAAIDVGCEYFVMEVSSHAIAQNRIEGLDFDLKIFTNLSQDHLDFHKTFDEYARVKSSFFSDETPKLINKDDKFIKFNPKNSMTYSLESEADFFVDKFSLKGGIEASIAFKQNSTLKSHLQGKFNLYNLLAAFGAIKFLTNLDDQKIADALGKFEGVEGRVEIVSKNPLVIVDFAHTPDGIEKVLGALSHDELIVVFGAGGDRDRTKRPIMGKIAQKYAKFTVVTSDNPRSEEPDFIIDEIMAGMSLNDKVFRESDRKKAINLALSLAKNGETIVILGKGDEPYQEINGVKHPFSDKLIAQEIINATK